MAREILTLNKKPAAAAVESAVVQPEPQVEAPEQPRRSDEPMPFVKANPQDNPRNQALKELADQRKQQAQTEFNERLPEINDETGEVSTPDAPVQTVGDEPPLEKQGQPETPPDPETPVEAAPETPAGPKALKDAIDPEAEYELVVDGKPTKVKGSQIVRTVSVSESADRRLALATSLLETAKTQQPPKEEKKPLDMKEITKAIRFGDDQAAEKAMVDLAEAFSAPRVDPAQVVHQLAPKLVQDQLEFNKASEFVKSEYADLLANPYLARMFVTEEQRRRAPVERGGDGDQRPYIELYRSIGEDLRKSFNIPKASAASQAPKSMEQRREAKAAAPSVPKTAAARLEATAATPKAKAPGEIIESIRAQRHQTSIGSYRR